jgi:hypothetical protein
MKRCAFCAEEIQDDAVVCRYCGLDLQGRSIRPLSSSTPATATTILSIPQRHAILTRALQTQLIANVRIESQSDTQAVLIFGKAPNHVLHFLVGLFTLGIWWIVWVVLVLTNREFKRVITVNEFGAIESRDMVSSP